MNSTLPGDQDPLGIFHHEFQLLDPTDASAPADPDPPTRAQRNRLVLGVLAAVAALCCGGSVIVGALAASSTSSRKPAAVADGTAADAASPDPIPSDDPGQDRESRSPVASSARPAAGLVGAQQARTQRAVSHSPSASGLRSPTPVPSARSSLTTTPPATTRPPAVTGGPTTVGVHAGAFCSPAGAFGTTSTGTLMRCAATPTDPKLRWRKA